MILTEAQARALRTIRARQKHWRGIRWIGLALGFAAVVAGFYVPWQLAAEFPDGTAGAEEVSEFTLGLSMMLLERSIEAKVVLFAGMLVVVFVLGRWRGNPSDVLLLGILDSLENQESAPANPDVSPANNAIEPTRPASP